MVYEFKRENDRIIKNKVPNSRFVQRIFWSRIMLAIHQSKFIVNIDESSFNRSGRSHYSWLSKNSSHPILNTLRIRRITVIFGLWTNDKWLAMTLNGNTNSESFILYLLVLTNFVKMSFKNVDFPITGVLDNAAVHTTENTKSATKFLKIKLNLIPPYWQHLVWWKGPLDGLKRKLEGNWWTFCKF